MLAWTKAESVNCAPEHFFSHSHGEFNKNAVSAYDFQKIQQLHEEKNDILKCVYVSLF